uniref:alpha-tectorin-like n=1 Tax=Solea senegalensis TaxID=28829 RepID=UPI001CD8C3C1|nr:alpha-tectorin-like [Solea senegalensis]
MLCSILYVAALAFAGTAATSQPFPRYGEMDISSCPITYYGRQYDKVYVAFNASRSSVCFNGIYEPGLQNDCILMSRGTADRADLEVLTQEIPTGSGVHQLIPELKTAGKCVNRIPFKDSDESNIEQIELGNFGAQAILAIRTYSGYTHDDVETDVQVNGRTVSKQTFQTNETDVGVITDVSGCRHSGAVYKTDTTVTDPRICSSVTCDANGVATAVSDCGPMEHCDGNGSCIFNHICTVTGFSVIDFIGRVHSIPDRCGYTLLGSSPMSGLKVVGVFQERRRKDVSFLEHVILQLESEGVEISLEQGGSVLLNGEELHLGTEAQVVHGVELSKDWRGVTAKILGNGYTVYIHFDGNTAYIHITGATAAQVTGLCGTVNTTVSGEMASAHSASGCQEQHVEDPDATVDCDAATEWCSRLKEAPFTTCSEHIDPESYVTACQQMLCKYPAVDGLKCQFLQAYVKGCRLRNNVTVEGWKSKYGCSHQVRCQDMYCSDHEFCGVALNGETSCLCRASFASKYEPTNSFGEPTVCNAQAASITLANCLLAATSINYTALQLNDQSCKGELDKETHMVTFNFDSSDTCGTVVMLNDSRIVYKNTITTRNSSTSSLINRQTTVQIDFSCFYTQPDTKSLGITVKDSSVTQEIVSGAWGYNLTMEAYTSPGSKNAKKNLNVQLDEKIWVDLKTEGLDGEFVAVVTDACWATNMPSPNASLRYDLIIDGCPNPIDKTVKTMANGVGTSSTFFFSAFQFTGKDRNVYLHCQVKLCVKQRNDCMPKCGHPKRKVRSVMPIYEEGAPALINLAWTY